MQRIRVTTSFDITQTGVKRPYKQQTLPITINNNLIETEDDWNFLRRQHSNWESVLQVLLFRIQPMDLSDVVKEGDKWTFTFSSDREGVFLLQNDPLGALKEDAEGTPILIGLTEAVESVPYICTSGDNQNIWFEEYEEETN